MVSKKEMYLNFRDAINKLTGKQELIDKYNHAVHALSRKSDSMQAGAQKQKLLDQLTKIDEEEWMQEDKNVEIYAVKSFNPYALTTSKSAIKAKLVALEQLMQEYKVK